MSTDPVSSVSSPGPAPAGLERGFFAAAPGCILLVDPDTGTIREANAACAALTGYLREELAGMTLRGLTAPEDRRDRATGALDRLRERGEPLRMDARYLRKDGRTIWGAVAMTPLAGEDGRVGTIVVQIDDLTERKRSDADRRLADLRFRRLVEEIPAAVFALPLEPGGAVSYLSPRIAELTGHDPAELEGTRRFLEPFIHPDDAPAVRARRDEAERTLEPYAVRYRIRRADGGETWLNERGMVVRDELGVPRYWQGVLVDAGVEMAGREALADSEALFRSTFEHGALGMAVVDAEGRILEANPAFCTMLGRAREEMPGLSWRELSAPDSIDANAALFDELRRGERDTYLLEKDYLRADGTTFRGRLSVSAVRDADGALVRAVSQVEDVTAEREAQAALAESEAFFRTFFERARIGIATATPDGRLIDVNPAFRALVGYAREELVDRPFAEITHPDDVAESAAEFRRMARGESDGFRTDKRYRRKDGSLVWARTNVAAVRRADGTMERAVGQVEDISAEKAAQEALAASEALFRSSFENARVSMILATPEGIMLDANPAACGFLGRDRDWLAGRHFREITHPDDVASSVDNYRRTVEGEIPGFTLEKRYLRADGSTPWGWLNIAGVRGEDGRATLLLAQIEDIDARKAAEAALAESEALFRSVFEDAAIGMTIADEDGRFLAANPAFCAMLGRDLGEIVGRSYAEITYPDDLAPSIEAAARLNAGEVDSYQVEKRYLHADGHPVWCRLNVSCVRGPDGRIDRKISQVEDISARKAAEAAQAESEALFRAAFDDAAIGMALADPQGRLTDANPAFSRLLGYTRDELLAMDFATFTHPDDLAREMVEVARVQAGEIDHYRLEKRYVRKDGEIVWVNFTGSAVRGPDGEFALAIGQVEDITARKAAEAQLAESEALYRGLVEQIPATVYRLPLDPSLPPIFISPKIAALIGRAPAGLSRDRAFLRDVIHPDDLAASLPIVEESDRTLEPCILHYRLRHADGRWIWVLDTSEVVRDERGDPVCWQGLLIDVTAEQELREALAESEARFRELFEQAAAAIVTVSVDGRLLDANPSACRMLGYDADELRAMDPLDIIYADDRPAPMAAFRRLAAGEIDRDQVELRMVRRDGGIVWTRVNSAAVRGPGGEVERIVSQAEDISAVRLAREALAASEQRFRALVERSTDAMVIADADGAIRWASPAILGLLGRAPEDVIGLPRQALLHPDDRAVASEGFAALLAAPLASTRIEIRLAHADGSWRWVEVAAANHLDNPAVAGLVYNIRDITERKQAERKIAEALELQRRANDELVALGQQRSEFLAMLAHDFRTPLTSIQGYSELLKLEAGGNPEIAAEADVIHDAAVRLNRMVEDLLTVETLEKRLGQLDLKPTDLGRLVRDAVDTVAGASPGRAVEVDLPPDLPEMMVDRDQLTRAIVNLVGNALKYSPDGSPVRVTADLAGGRVEIAVSDNGFGIPADRLETIFEKYGRVRTAETEGIPGVGLGLPIVRAIARAHGGDAWAESERGVGSTFRLALPVGSGA